MTRVLRLGLVVAWLSAPAPLPADDLPSLTAIRAVEGIRVDGRLDEAAWLRAPVARGFRQVEPQHGAAATLDTEVRVVFDDAHLYVGIVARDPAGRRGVRAVSMERDFDFYSNDLVGITLDPFRDRRNAVGFQVNPYGARRDVLAFDDAMFDRDWNGAWTVRTTIADSGWVAELAIPWSTLRYPRVGDGSWGVQFVRLARRLNEESGWSPWPRGASNNRMEYAGTLVGLHPPPPSRNLRVQPFVTGRGQSGASGGAAPRRTALDLGGDLKWAVTTNTVVDVTVNTDFAEADVDRQVLNLTRFSTFFPERRQFFLEGASLFETGRDGGNLRPFHSRRIGLDGGNPVPLDAGVRLIHRSADRSAGGLFMRQRAAGGVGTTHFAVGRLTENVGAGHRVGGAVIHRSESGSQEGDDRHNTVAVVDGLLRVGRSGTIRGMISGSSDGEAGGDLAGYLWASTSSARGYFGWIQEYVGAGYRAESGFLGRSNYVWTSPAVTLDWRPAWRPAPIRRFSPGFTTSFYHDGEPWRFREGSVSLRAVAQFQNSAELRLWTRPEWQRLERPFSPLPGMSLAPGAYNFTLSGITFQPDLSRPYWAFVTVAAGRFFDGARQQVIFRASPLPGPRWRVTVDYEGNRFSGLGPQSVDRTTHLASALIRFTPSPALNFSAYYEYSSTTRLGAWNARLAWEFRPLSHLYLVFNDRTFRPDGPTSSATPSERQVLLKVTWLGQL